MNPSELKIGKLYRYTTEYNFTKSVWKVNLLSIKKINRGDIFLFLKPKNFANSWREMAIFYLFLDKDGEELWFEEYEIEYLKEVKEETNEFI